MRIEAVLLGEIENVELYVSEEIIVLDAEKEPLVMAASIWINSHKKVEFLIIWLSLDGHVEVTTFEIRVKFEDLVSALYELHF